MRGSLRVWRELELGGGVGGGAGQELVSEERAEGGGRARDRRRGEAVGAELREPALGLVVGRRSDRPSTPGGERAEVAPVRLDGARRAPRGEQGEEAFDLVVVDGRHGRSRFPAQRRGPAPGAQERGRAVVDAAQPAGVHVAVDLRRRERGVSEQLLDRAQVGTALEQVRREGVAEAVRMRQDSADRARVEPAAARREEERVLRTACELRPGLAEIAPEHVRGLLAERHDALLAALAAHAHELLVEVHVAEIEADGLGAAQPAGVRQLDERPVAQRQRPGPREPVEQLLHLVELRRLRQAARAARGESALGHARRAERRAQEGANGGESPPDRRGREPVARASQLGHVLGESADVHVVEPQAPLGKPRREVPEVRGVRAASRRRERRAVEEALDRGAGVHLQRIPSAA